MAHVLNIMGGLWGAVGGFVNPQYMQAAIKNATGHAWGIDQDWLGVCAGRQRGRERGSGLLPSWHVIQSSSAAGPSHLVAEPAFLRRLRVCFTGRRCHWYPFFSFSLYLLLLLPCILRSYRPFTLKQVLSCSRMFKITPWITRRTIVVTFMWLTTAASQHHALMVRVCVDAVWCLVICFQWMLDELALES